MLSAKAIFGEIFDNDEAFGLFCSIAASDEAQGGWENGRIAALVPESYQDLAPKIARHGADEDKHGRIFTALLRKRGLQPVPVPAETDYTMRLERAGLGLPHGRLRREERLTERDIIAYLAHSRVTEQRASEQMQALRKYAGSRQDIGRAITMISADEDNHLAYCHEELLRLAAAGHAEAIRHALRATALAETAIYRDVSRAVMAHLARILRWPWPKAAMLAAGIQAVYLYERLGGWRRMVSLQVPSRRNALGGPPPAQSEFTPASPGTGRLPGPLVKRGPPLEPGPVPGAGRRNREGRKNVKRYQHVGRRVAVLGLSGAAVAAVAASPALAKSDIALSVTPRVVHAGQSVHVNASGGDDAYPGEELCLDARPGRAAWHTVKCVRENRGTGGPLLDTTGLTRRGSESFRAQLLRLSGRHLVADRTSGTIVVTLR